MELKQFATVGIGRVTKMTDDFCTLEIYGDSITATELQAMLDDDWEQQGEPQRDTFATNRPDLIYNFRKIKRT